MKSDDSQILRLNGTDAVLPALGLWLDPHRPRDFAFVSHAHADHFAPHRRILCSKPTRLLIEARYGSTAQRAEFLDLDFGESLVHQGHRLELRPAGHIAGSAMLLVENLKDGHRLLHTGDFKMRAGAGAETARPCQADWLIMETTFGLPKYRFPAALLVWSSLVDFAHECLEEGLVPLLMAYALGKAQEILLEMHQRAPDLAFQVHDSVAKMNEAMMRLGYELPPCEPFSPKEHSPQGKVVILPPSAGRSVAVRRLKDKVRLAMVSGWALEPGARYRYQCDEVFAISDHADYDELLALVEAVNPSRIGTIHGFAKEFAADLRRRGREAWPLVGETQLEFDDLAHAGRTVRFDGTAPGPPTSQSMEAEPLPDSGFGRFTRLCEEIAAASGKTKKRALLATYLRPLSEAELPWAVRFLSGRPLPRSPSRRPLAIGWALWRQALIELSGWNAARLRQLASELGDPARTTALVLQGNTHARPQSLESMAEALAALADASGALDKLRRLRELLGSLHPSEAAVLAGMLLGDLRIGLKEGLLEEGVAEAFTRPLAAVREAHQLRGDLGEVARMARANTLEGAQVTWFTPLRVMLASPGQSAAEIFERLGASGPVWLEDKYDGIRAQLHCRGGEAALYSRDLRPLEQEFPELVAAAMSLDRDLILDGEIIAFAEGRRLSFFDLQKRLGRRDQRLDQGDLFFGAAVPVRFVAFDLLGLDGEGWLERPLRERRSALESLCLPEAFVLSELTRAGDVGEIEEALRLARRRHQEGLMAKDPESRYLPGRRGQQWLKLKEVLPTLDVVVVRAQQGHGKRAHVLSDYTFAVRDEATGALRVIGKAYSGLSDEEIEALTAHFRERTLEKRRGVHVLEPDTVLEVAFDSIRPSQRHDSGLALRFPRIRAIRRDKGIDEIDTLDYARRLAGVAIPPS